MLLHLYSGQRREGDLQYWTEHIAPPTDAQLYVLSIDIANDANKGDLTKWTTVNFWILQMRDGRVAALLAGPPCETWSAARTRPLPNVKRQPRPLRSRQQPWGLSYLSNREYDQLDLGNQLLRVTILFLYVAYHTRVPAIMEHPATADDERMVASSWLLDETRHLLARPGVDLVTFDQCMTGQISRKPTSLMCVHAPTVRDVITSLPNRGRCNHGFGAHDALLGQNEDGTWRSAAAKTYPSDMCRRLATALLRAIADRWTQHGGLTGWHLPDDYAQFYVPLDPYKEFHRSTDCMAHRHLRPEHQLSP